MHIAKLKMSIVKIYNSDIEVTMISEVEDIKVCLNTTRDQHEQNEWSLDAKLLDLCKTLYLGLVTLFAYLSFCWEYVKDLISNYKNSIYIICKMCKISDLQLKRLRFSEI